MRSVRLKYCFLVLSLFLGTLVSCGVKKGQKDRPDTSAYSIKTEPRIQFNDSLYFKGANSLRKNQFGQWELVASGNPLDLGNTIGDLSQELIRKQEEIFFTKVEELVPSRSKQFFLRKFLAWYNRQMYLHVKKEYKIELKSISEYTSDKYDFIADKYLRTMYLHSAHDIGHAMQDLALVGCSSFAVWGENTADGNLLIARNFDFYAGDDFAQDKVISFIQPEKGYNFMSVSWAGMIGVMSGMNVKGLTVTINAGKSDVPLKAKTPISLVTREIVQYASNIDEAIEIAKEREIFVSESILVGSTEDNKAVIIEMSPENFGVFEVENSSRLICSNHFQSTAYQTDDNNLDHIANSHSQYRYDRMEELLDNTQIVTPEKAVAILRNTKGHDDKDIGYGNEKALNQLLAHHGIIFEPYKKMVWVSSNPYQLGEFVAFQLDSVFLYAEKKESTLSMETSLIEKDSFVNTQAFGDYEEYRKTKRNFEHVIDENLDYSPKDLDRFISLNSESWEVYYLVGTYYFNKKYYKAALLQFEIAHSKEITTLPERKEIEKYIKKIKRRINDS